jgi:DNA-binding NarL/FixJ family response regulator
MRCSVTALRSSWLQMPEMNGFEAMIAICGEFPQARVIVLTTYTGHVQVMRALKAGARG